MVAMGINTLFTDTVLTPGTPVTEKSCTELTPQQPALTMNKVEVELRDRTGWIETLVESGVETNVLGVAPLTSWLLLITQYCAPTNPPVH